MGKTFTAKRQHHRIQNDAAEWDDQGSEDDFYKSKDT